MNADEKPFFANGTIVGDYKPLMAYWRILRKKGDTQAIEDSLLKREDFEEISRLVREAGRISLEDLLARLKEYFRQRVRSDAAVDAIREVYGVEVDPEDAVDRIAHILAGWLIEAGGITGLVSIRRKYDRN